jgi:hypothetical protein
MPITTGNKTKEEEAPKIEHLDVNTVRYLTAISLLSILSEQKAFTFVLENIIEMAKQGGVSLDITYTEEDGDNIPSQDVLEMMGDYFMLIGYKVEYNSVGTAPYISISWSIV